MRASFPAILVAMLLAAGPQPDPLRLERLATDEELVFEAPGIESPGEEPPGHPIRSLVADDYADLGFLRESLDGVRIVQLGESGHGMAETFLLKSRLVRFLGSASSACGTPRRYCLCSSSWRRRVAGASRTRAPRPADPRRREAGRESRCGWPGSTSSRSDRTRSTGRGSWPGSSPTWTRYGRTPYARSIRRSWPNTRRAGRRGGRISASTGRSSCRHTIGRACSSSARCPRSRLRPAVKTRWSVSRRPTRAPPTCTSRPRPMSGRTRRAAIGGWRRTSASFTRSSSPAPASSSGGTTRTCGTRTRTSPCAAAPTARGSPSGPWARGLREWYGKEVFTIGQYAFGGEAANNSRDVYRIEPAPQGTLEHRLAEARRRLWFVDLRATRSLEGGGWAREPQIARFNGQTHQVLVPADQYDALILVADVTPPRFLY